MHCELAFLCHLLFTLQRHLPMNTDLATEETILDYILLFSMKLSGCH